MNRRALLQTAGISLTGAIAGCSSDSPNDDRTEESDDADTADGTETASPEQSPPQLSLQFDHDGSTGVMTVTHDGGDTADAANLYFVSDGIIDPMDADPDVTQSDTSWASATGETEIWPGKSVTLGHDGESRIQLVWRSPAGDETTVVGQYN